MFTLAEVIMFILGLFTGIGLCGWMERGAE